ncbi:MAG: NfeD family protein [Eubacteriales bacterium]|jgi:membrane-bound serine protease (ClpP class)|nr:NfeD family protein [Eubacteriales bacterium]
MNIHELLGPTAAATIVCLIIALVMFFIELFTPGVGLAGVSGLLSLIAVIVMQLGWGQPRVAMYIIAISLLIIILGLIWVIRSLQRGRLSRSFLVLKERVDGTSVPDVAAAKMEMVGRTGIAITTLRPAGIAEIDGKRVDVTTAGGFIAKGETITVLKADSMQILVATGTADETDA